MGFNPISTVVASASVIDWQSCSNHQSDFIWKAGGRINLNIFQLNATNDLFRIDGFKKNLASHSTPHMTLIRRGTPDTTAMSAGLSDIGREAKIYKWSPDLIAMVSSINPKICGNDLVDAYLRRV